MAECLRALTPTHRVLSFPLRTSRERHPRGPCCLSFRSVRHGLLPIASTTLAFSPSGKEGFCPSSPTLNLFVCSRFPAAKLQPSRLRNAEQNFLPFIVVLAAASGQSRTESASETPEWAIQEFYTLRKDVETTKKRVEEVTESAGLEQLEIELVVLEEAAADSSLWDNPKKAQETLLSLNDIKDKIKSLADFKSKVEDTEMIVNLTEEIDSIDSALLEEGSKIIRELTKSLDLFELTQLLSGPYDKEGAVLTVTAGAGSTDAQDWADMLLRMYIRWGEKQRYKTRVVDKSLGEEAGIKSATVEIEGRFAYGYLSGEKGTHRIVRQSPFNAKGLRQTSFAGVEVMPLLPEESLDVEIPEDDLEISYSRVGGKGGQNVNKVETAVRIVHIPTGITVRCTVALVKRNVHVRCRPWCLAKVFFAILQTLMLPLCLKARSARSLGVLSQKRDPNLQTG